MSDCTTIERSRNGIPAAATSTAFVAAAIAASVAVVAGSCGLPFCALSKHKGREYFYGGRITDHLLPAVAAVGLPQWRKPANKGQKPLSES
jgi:hypothetical protein